MSTEDRVEDGKSGPIRIKLALVLNGGVSLAVWMAGVVRELEIARRASRGEYRPLEDGPARRHYDFWRAILEDTRIDIDIISGTSAGGLNGTLLAAALATGTELQDLRAMWRESAALTEGALLRKPGSSPLRSILDGEYFEEKIRIEIDRATQHSATSGLPITLFITATSLGSADREYLDSADRPFSAADHRCVYRFRNATTITHDSVADQFRSESRNDFAQGLPDLTRAARASAGFPVAFEPVQETAALAGNADISVRRPTGREPKWLIDGGVLDNAPFEAVIDEILSRPLEKEPVRRVLAYIAPSNGRARSGSEASAGRPGWTSVLGAAQGFPRESDFRDDVHNIERNLLLAATANEGVEVSFRRFVDASDSSFRDTLRETARLLLPQYRNARITTGCATVQRHLASRLSMTRKVGAPLAESTDPLGTWLSEDLPSTPSGLGLDATERSVRLLMKIARETGSHDAAQQLSDVVMRLSALRDEQNQVLVACAQDSDVPMDALLSGNRAMLDNVIGLAYHRMSLTRCLEIELQQSAEIYAKTSRVLHDNILEGLVSCEVVAQALSPSLDPIVAPQFDFLRIGPDRRSPLVVKLAGGTDATEHPLAELGEDKLYGTRLGHFGAFGEPNWRDNDWMWGRLDGAAHLVRNLGLSDELALEAQRLTLQSDGFSSTTLLDNLRELNGLKDAGLVDELRETRSGRDSLALVYDSVLRLLGGTEEELPKYLRSYGPWIQAAFQMRQPPPHWPENMPIRARLGLLALGKIAKGKFRSWLNKPAGS